MLANADAGFFHYRSVIVNRSLYLSLLITIISVGARRSLVAHKATMEVNERQSIPIRAVLYLVFLSFGFFVERRKKKMIE